MKTPNHSTCIILLLILLSACQSTAAVAPTTSPSTPVSTLRPATSAAPTQDPAIISPANAPRLEVLRSIGRGSPQGTPHYSPDGKWMALSTTSGVYIYDTQNYQIARLLTPANDANVAFSPAGNALAVGNQLFSLEDGHLLQTFDISGVKDSPNWMWDLSFAPNGRQVAIPYFDTSKETAQETIAVFQASDGQLLRTYTGDRARFSPDGRFILVRAKLSPDGSGYRLSVYENLADKPLHEWAANDYGVLPGNRAWVSADSSDELRIYDLETGHTVIRFKGKFAAFAPDGQRMALLTQGKIMQYRVADGQPIGPLEGDFSGINQASLLFALDGQTIAGATGKAGCCGQSEGDSFSVWRSDGSLIRNIPASIQAFEFAPDGRTLAIEQPEANQLEIWRVSDGSTQTTLDGFTAAVTNLVFLPDGRQLVASTYGDSHSPMLLYDVENGQLIRSWPTDQSSPDHRLAVRPDGQVLALGNAFWQVSDGQSLPGLARKMIDTYSYGANSVAFSPDGRMVATGAIEGNLQIWNFDEQTLVSNQTVCGTDTVSGLSFSADSRQLAVACTDVLGQGQSSVQVYPVSAAGQRLMELRGAPGSSFTRVQYAPNGRYLAASGVPYASDTSQNCPTDSSSQAQVWNAADGRQLATLPTGCVASLAFSPDSQLLAFGLWDGTIELWSLPGGQKIASLPGSEYAIFATVNALGFSPDGKRLAAGYADGSVKLWGLPVH